MRDVNMKGSDHSEDFGKNNIKINRVIGTESVDLIHLAQDRGRCLVLVNTIMNAVWDLRFSQRSL
jgi:hypothetical protein